MEYIILILGILFVVGIGGAIVALAVVLRQNSKRRALAGRSALERALDPKNFYIPEPRRPGVDIRAWMLSAPALASVVGFFCFSVLAYSFTEMATWSDEFRHTMVILGAFTLAGGSEIGTYAAVEEIFRKSKGGKPGKLDIAALCISGLATAAALFLSIAALMGARSDWPIWVTLYGPIGVIICTALDAYAGMMESGLYKSGFDDRHEKWNRLYCEWCKGVSAQLGYSKIIESPTESVESKTNSVESNMNQVKSKMNSIESTELKTNSTESENTPVQRVLKMVKESEFNKQEKAWLLNHLGLINIQKRIAQELNIAPSSVSVALRKRPDQLSESVRAFAKRINGTLRGVSCTESHSSQE